MKTPRKTTALTALGLAAMMLAGCASASADPGAGDEVSELRLGYFANVTHAPALVGLSEGLFQEALGDIDLKTEVFNAGPAAIEALSAGAIDATYIGPNPSINTFIQSGGESANIIAGATSGGAALVVNDSIQSVADLKGKTIATPQLGSTQDVALRSWLSDEGFETSTSGGGDVSIAPTENAQTLTLFQDGQVDGAWLPEPWVSRLVVEAGAHVLVNEAEIWPGGEFPTTVLLVRKDFAKEHPEIVDELLQGHIASIAWLAENTDEAPGVINEALVQATGKGLPDAVLARALDNVTFTVDPAASTFEQLVENGLTAGTQKKGSIDGLFDLSALNKLLKDADAGTVSSAGLGED